MITPELSLSEYTSFFKNINPWKGNDPILKELDESNSRLLEAVWHYGPRNISLLSRTSGIPRSTLTYRLNRLTRIGLKIIPSIHLPTLGLKEAFFSMSFKHDMLLKLYRILMKLPIATIRIMLTSRVNIEVGVYVNDVTETSINSFVDHLRETGIIVDYKHEIISDDILTTVVSHTYYDYQSQSYTYKWAEWIREVIEAPDLPKLMYKEVSKELLDSVDLKILELLLTNPTIDYVDMEKSIGLNYQTLRYHYIKHIENRGVIAGWTPLLIPVDLNTSYMKVLRVKFSGSSEANKFINSMFCTPLVIRVAQTSRENEYIFDIVIPRGEELGFTWFLEKLTNMGFIDSSSLSLSIPETSIYAPPPLCTAEELKKNVERTLSSIDLKHSLSTS